MALEAPSCGLHNRNAVLIKTLVISITKSDSAGRY